MKSVLAMLGCVLATLSPALGQGFSIELIVEQEQYLPAEPLPVKVRIVNLSGQDLHLGTDPNWLTLTVEDSRHLAVSKQGTVPVTGEFILGPSITGTKTVDLAPSFDLIRAGRYYVSATVMVPKWGQALQTKAIPFDIIRGNSIWEQEFGVPASGRGDVMPEMRRYALVQTLHSKVVQLYFRLTDSHETRVIRIFRLGPMVSFGSPEAQIDLFSNCHVLYQTGGRMFLHCLINPDGVLLVRETFEYSNTRPALRAEKDGRIAVAGGVRRVMASDLPPPAISQSTSNAKLDQH